MPKRVILFSLMSMLLSATAFGQQPTLGAPKKAFQVAYGPAVRDFGEIADFKKCPGRTALAEWAVMFDRVERSPLPATPVHRRSTTSLWPSAKQSSFPPDAVAVTEFTTSDERTLVFGPSLGNFDGPSTIGLTSLRWNGR